MRDGRASNPTPAPSRSTGPRLRGDLIEFAQTATATSRLDAAIERTDAVRSRWEEDGTLPDDVDDLRACLFCEYRRERFFEHDVFSVSDRDDNLIHEADPNRVTQRRGQERYKRALFDRIAQRLGE